MPRRVKSRRMVDWSGTTPDRLKGWEPKAKKRLFQFNKKVDENFKTKIMWRLFKFKRKEEETWKIYCMRTARGVRIIWKKMNFFSDLK